MNPFTLEEIGQTDLSPREITLVGSTGGVRFVRFKHAILARAETNLNRDHIDDEGIRQLAATLPLNGIDDEHKKDLVIGYFTDARAVMDGATLALDTDGILFADRFPAQVQQVLNGEKLLSIEADAETATCSVCNGVFKTSSEYCADLQSRLIDRKAERRLHGLTAKGGATTTHPAGTKTEFNQDHIEFLASVWGQGDHAKDALTPPGEVVSCANALEYRLYQRDPEAFQKRVASRQVYATRQQLPDRKFGMVEKVGEVTVRHGLQGPTKASVDGSVIAIQRFYAALAMDPTPTFPGGVVYRPVFSPLMWYRNPEWLSQFSQKPATEAKTEPSASTPATSTAASTEEVKKALEEHLQEEAPKEVSTLTGFMWGPEPPVNSPTLKLEWT